MIGNIFQYGRQPGSPRIGQLPTEPALPSEPLDDSPIPSSQIRDIAVTEGEEQMLGERHRASATTILRSTVSRYATAWADRFEGALHGRGSWAILADIDVEIRLSEVPLKHCP